MGWRITLLGLPVSLSFVAENRHKTFPKTVTYVIFGDDFDRSSPVCGLLVIATKIKFGPLSTALVSNS